MLGESQALKGNNRDVNKTLINELLVKSPEAKYPDPGADRSSATGVKPAV